jgi:hypothetical protein
MSEDQMSMKSTNSDSISAVVGIVTMTAVSTLVIGLLIYAVAA